jgi:hypothetical protein
MAYLSSLLRQSDARIGVVRRLERAARPAAGLEVDDVRVVAPAPSEQSAARLPAPAASPAPVEEPPAVAKPAAAAPQLPLVEAASTPAAMPVAEPSQPAKPVADTPEPTRRPRIRAEKTLTERLESPPVRSSPERLVPPALDRLAVERTSDADMPVGQHVLRQVAEVVAWVVEGAEEEKPGPVAMMVVQPREERVLPAEPAAPPRSDRLDEEPAAPTADISVSVGTVEVTVEAPDAPAPVVPFTPPSPAPAAEPPPVASGVGLTRHYLRG